MVKVFFTSGTHTEQVATFQDEDLYISCLNVLKASAKADRMTVIESIE
jgi:hypothetical protein